MSSLRGNRIQSASGPETSAPTAEGRARHISFDVNTPGGHPGNTTQTGPAQRGRSGVRNGLARSRAPSPYPHSNDGARGMAEMHVKFVQPSCQERMKKDRKSIGRPPSPYPGQAGQGAAKSMSKRVSQLIHDALSAASNMSKKYDIVINPPLSYLILTKDGVRSEVQLRQ
ncbi:hypothetical protein F5Y05DRAFT_236515 [Hypoxylon sp. FL0543]|nr:hypothetical protein F5Y05DRAFT_236515 [Hypoxylon sp. FL0543]